MATSCRVGRGSPFPWTGLKAAAKPFSDGDKADGRIAVEALAIELDALQNLFYADRRYKLLVVLQGTDTSARTAPSAACSAA